MTRRTGDLAALVVSGFVGAFVAVGMVVGGVMAWAARRLDRETT